MKRILIIGTPLTLSVIPTVVSCNSNYNNYEQQKTKVICYIGYDFDNDCWKLDFYKTKNPDVICYTAYYNSVGYPDLKHWLFELKGHIGVDDLKKEVEWIWNKKIPK